MPCQVDWLGMVQMEQQFTCRKTKTPPKRGSVGHDGLLTLLAAGTDHFDLDAAVLCPALPGVVVPGPVLLAPALRVNYVGLHAPRHDVSLDPRGAAPRDVL